MAEGGHHLGSASVVTGASGTVVGEQRYYPFGETRWTTGSMLTDKLFTGQREMEGLGILARLAAGDDHSHFRSIDPC